jgi:hypothetical protein
VVGADDASGATGKAIVDACPGVSTERCCRHATAAPTKAVTAAAVALSRACARDRCGCTGGAAQSADGDGVTAAGAFARGELLVGGADRGSASAPLTPGSRAVRTDGARTGGAPIATGGVESARAASTYAIASEGARLARRAIDGTGGGFDVTRSRPRGSCERWEPVVVVVARDAAEESRSGATASARCEARARANFDTVASRDQTLVGTKSSYSGKGGAMGVERIAGPIAGSSRVGFAELGTMAPVGCAGVAGGRTRTVSAGRVALGSGGDASEVAARPAAVASAPDRGIGWVFGNCFDEFIDDAMRGS